MSFRHLTAAFAFLAGSAAFVLAPAVAFAAEPGARPKLTPVRAFVDAPPATKILVLILLLAILAALVVTVRRLISPAGRSGGSAFLSALRLGGPLIALMGAANTALMVLIGIANTNVTRPLAVYAPGLVESALLLTLGLMAGVVAVVGLWLVDARPARAVRA